MKLISHLIKYKMNDISSVGSINLEYKTTAGGGSQTVMKLNKDGYSQSGKSGCNAMIPREEVEITLKVKWNGKEETIILKAKYYVKRKVRLIYEYNYRKRCGPFY
jgi:hypothetical protein